MGVYTIVTGNLDVTLTPAKRFADQIETVSTADLDALEALAKEVKADGIMTGSSEFSIEMTMALCKRLNKPFYCTCLLYTSSISSANRRCERTAKERHHWKGSFLSCPFWIPNASGE